MATSGMPSFSASSVTPVHTPVTQGVGDRDSREPVGMR